MEDFRHHTFPFSHFLNYMQLHSGCLVPEGFLSHPPHYVSPSPLAAVSPPILPYSQLLPGTATALSPNLYKSFFNFENMLDQSQTNTSHPEEVRPTALKHSTSNSRSIADGMMMITVTPPLTPLITSEQGKGQSNQEKTAGTDTQALPVRTSSRNRRPPAFIEGESSCPLCGCLLRSSELDEHYQKELDSLKQDLNNTGEEASKRKARETKLTLRSGEKRGQSQSDSRRNVLSRVRLNRQQRHSKSSVNNRKCQPAASNGNNESIKPAGTFLPSTSQPEQRENSTCCPVCGKKMKLDAEQMTLHVESCLSKQSNSPVNQSTSSSAGNSGSSDDEYETYTWCGQTRVRATSMLDNEELAASGFEVVTKSEGNEGDIVVDDDEMETEFGKAQYTEADIIPCASEEPDEAKAQSALRLAVIRSSQNNDTGISNELSLPTTSKWTDDINVSGDQQLPDFKCLICMEAYTNPLVSVCCWHVHCEECWLRTLGAKKLCPQCNIITSPADLRKIYL